MTMITVPVLADFCNNEQIGTLTIDAAALPASPDFCFSIGYKQEAADGPYTVVCAAVVLDAAYARYLKHIDADHSAGVDGSREARG